MPRPRAPAIQEIRSRHNPLVKQIRRALERSERTQDGLLVLETPHLLEEAVESGLPVARVLFTADMEKDVLALLRKRDAEPELFRVAPAVLGAITSTEAPQGMVALVRPKGWEASELFSPEPGLVMVVAGVQDPGNVGAILRVAEAFGATGALLLRGTVRPENSKLLRAAAGSSFRLPHLGGVQLDQALALCAVHGLALYALEPRAERTLEDVDLRQPCALAVGAEGAGLPPPLVENARAVAIPRARRVESLNVAVAAALALYEAARQRRVGALATAGVRPG